MEKNIFLLLIVFIAIAVSSAIPEFYKASSALSRKEKVGRNNDDDDFTVSHVAGNGDTLDDELPEQSFSRRNRYHGHGTSLNGAKSRSRLVSIYDDDDEKASDWFKPPQFGLDLSSIFSGVPMPQPLPRTDAPSTCHTILDPQFTVFSDICGVMPQARYSLPNFFGHMERWQIAQALTTILGPTTISQLTDPGCSRSLRLLVCPLLFPPCKPKREILSTLPCQSFCRGVKASCPAPSIEHIPCEFLAPTSEICPVNPLPYTSLLNSFGGPSPFGIPPMANRIQPAPFPALFNQPPFPSPIPTPSIFSQQQISSPMQNPFQGQSTLSSAIQTPPLNPLLQFQNNNMQGLGLAHQPYTSYLQSAGIYTSPTIQPQYQQQLQQPLQSQQTQPQLQQTTVQQPIQQQTIQPQTMQQPTIQQPTIQQPAIQQPTMQQPTIQQPTMQPQMFQQQPLQQQLLQQQPMAQPLLQQQQQTLQQPLLQQQQQTLQQPLFQQQNIQQNLQQQLQDQLQQQLQKKQQQNPTLKPLDSTKLMSDTLSSLFVDLPEFGTAGDSRKGVTGNVFPAMRSFN